MTLALQLFKNSIDTQEKLRLNLYSLSVSKLLEYGCKCLINIKWYFKQFNVFSRKWDSRYFTPHYMTIACAFDFINCMKYMIPSFQFVFYFQWWSRTHRNIHCNFKPSWTNENWTSNGCLPSHKNHQRNTTTICRKCRKYMHKIQYRNTVGYKLQQSQLKTTSNPGSHSALLFMYSFSEVCIIEKLFK
jgi:hypothetical protein